MHFAAKNISNKTILESVSPFTYIEIKICFARGYVDVSKKTIFENWFDDKLEYKPIYRKRYSYFY